MVLEGADIAGDAAHQEISQLDGEEGGHTAVETSQSLTLQGKVTSWWVQVTFNPFVMVLSLNTAVTAGYHEVIKVSSVFSHSEMMLPEKVSRSMASPLKCLQSAIVM